MSAPALGHEQTTNIAPALPEANALELPKKPESDSRLAIGTIVTERVAEGDFWNPESVEVRQRVGTVIKSLQERASEIETNRMFPVQNIVSGSSSIEERQVYFIQQTDKTAVNFRLSPVAHGEVKQFLSSLSADSVEDGKYAYDSVTGGKLPLADCWTVKTGEHTTVYIAKDETVVPEIDYDYSKPTVFENGEAIEWEVITKEVPRKLHTTRGAIKIEVSGLADADQVTDEMLQAFQKLGLEDALERPDEQSQKDYKALRYRWQHGLEEDQVWETEQTRYREAHGTELIDHLQVQEVYPGYSTIIDNSAAENYQADGPITLFHAAHNIESLPSIFHNGLLSMDELHKRGVFAENKIGSGDADFFTGGALSVHLRAAAADPASGEIYFKMPTLIIDSSELDRTDWFAYTDDKYGSLDPETFGQRSLPEEFFDLVRSDNTDTAMNELLMRRAISPERIKGVYVLNAEAKDYLKEYLHNAGVDEVNGVPIEEFIHYPETLSDTNESMVRFLGSFHTGQED